MPTRRAHRRYEVSLGLVSDLDVKLAPRARVQPALLQNFFTGKPVGVPALVVPERTLVLV